jgi:hypothetical protein
VTVANLTAAQLKLILQTSEGFPTQHESSKAMVKAGSLLPSRAGHALSSHLRGTSALSLKTKFANLDEMSRALEAALRTPMGQAALQRLRPGMREPALTVDIQPQFMVSVVVDGGGATTYGPREFGAAGIHRLPCTLILEGRERAGTLHLHIQTFYPKLDSAQLEKLLAAK